MSATSGDAIYGTSGDLPGFPYSPGPDDDYRISFPTYTLNGALTGAAYTPTAQLAGPLGHSVANGGAGVPILQTNETWTGATLVNGGAGGAILYAALGYNNDDPSNSTGSFPGNNAVFWSPNPGSNNPVWYVGNPTTSTPAVVPDNETGEFPSGVGTTPTNGTVKITGVTDGAGGYNTYGYLVGNNGEAAVYAAVSNVSTGALLAVYETTNGGFSWASVSAGLSDYLSASGVYASAILVNPNNPANVYIGGTVSNGNAATSSGEIFETTNSGAGWIDISNKGGGGPHSSLHTIAYNSNNGKFLFGGDGGLWQWDPATQTWADLNGNLDITQVLGVASDPTTSSVLFATAQNEGSSTINLANGTTAWSTVDPQPGSTPIGIMGGGAIYVDPSNPQIVYAVQTTMESFAVVRMSTDGGKTWSTIENSSSRTIPMIEDQVNTNRVLVGGGTNDTINVYENGILVQTVFPTGLLGVTALAIPEYQGAFTADPDFTDVTDIGSTSYDGNTVYATDGTNIAVTKDDGLQWAARNIPGLVGTIVSLEVDPANRDTVYAVSQSSFNSQIWESNDAGQDWYQIANPPATTGMQGFPSLPAWTLVIDPRTGTVYAGTDIGVYELVGGSQQGQTPNNWVPAGVGLPNVQVRTLVLNQATNTLIAGTYGRGVFEMFLDAAAAAPVTTVTAAGTYAPTVAPAPITVLSGKSTWTGPITLAEGAGATFAITLYGNPGNPDPVSTAQLNILGSISDATLNSDPTFAKRGAGTLVLGGANTYGGVTDIAQGILIADNFQALGSTAHGTVVEPGTALELESSIDQEPLTLYGDGPNVPDEIGGIINSPNGVPALFNGHYTGALESVANTNTYEGPITLAMAGNGSGAPASISGVSETGTTVTITTTAAHNYQVGETVLIAGITPTGYDGLITITGVPTTTTFTYAAAAARGAATLSNATATPTGVTIGVASGSTLTITGNIGDAGQRINLTKELLGTLVLDDTTTYTGYTYVNQGALQVANTGALNSSLATDVFDGRKSSSTRRRAVPRSSSTSRSASQGPASTAPVPSSMSAATIPGPATLRSTPTPPSQRSPIPSAPSRSRWPIRSTRSTSAVPSRTRPPPAMPTSRG